MNSMQQYNQERHIFDTNHGQVEITQDSHLHPPSAFLPSAQAPQIHSAEDNDSDCPDSVNSQDSDHEPG